MKEIAAAETNAAADQARFGPSNAVPPNAGDDAADTARLDRFEELLNDDSGRGAIVKLLALREGGATVRLLKEVWKTPLGSSELRARLGMERKLYNTTLRRGKKRGLLIQDNDRISLTQLGRWHALAPRLGLTITELCVISEIYTTWAVLERHELRVHLKHFGMRERLGVTKNTMRKIYGNLVKMRYVWCGNPPEGESHSRDSMSMYAGPYKNLHEYMKDMVLLVRAKWKFSKPRFDKDGTEQLREAMANFQYWMERLSLLEQDNAASDATNTCRAFSDIFTSKEDMQTSDEKDET